MIWLFNHPKIWPILIQILKGISNKFGFNIPINKKGIAINNVQFLKGCPKINGINQPTKKGIPNAIINPKFLNFFLEFEKFIFNLIQIYLSSHY